MALEDEFVLIENFEDGVHLTKAQQKEIKKGVDFVRDWIKQRQKSDVLDDPDIDYNYDYKKAKEKLDTLQIVACGDLQGSYIKLLKEGKIHLDDEEIMKFDGNERAATQAKIDEIAADDYQGLSGFYPYGIRETVVFVDVHRIINVNESMKDKTGPDLRAASLSNIVAHEVTHALDLDCSESAILYVLNGNMQDVQVFKDNVERDDYWDSSEEVYARLKEFSKTFDLNPERKITAEKIAKIRGECEKRRIAYEQKGGEVPKKLDNHIFDRYTDEGIATMLNLTVQNENMSLSDEYEDFRRAAKVDLALSQYKMRANIKNAEKEAGLTKENGISSERHVREVTLVNSGRDYA